MKRNNKRSSELNQTSNITNTTTNANIEVPASKRLLLHIPTKRLFTIPVDAPFETIKPDEFVLVDSLETEQFNILLKATLLPITSKAAKLLFL